MRSRLESQQDAYGETLAEIGEEDERVVVLDADLHHSNRTDIFKERFPERFFEAGIAEANMIGVAAGLSMVGLIPFANSFAVFTTGRVYDQIRVSVCYPRSNVKIVGTSAGLSDCHDGATHQSIEDVAIMRALPNMIVVVPCDSPETREATRAIYNYVGPAYLRTNRQPIPVIWENPEECAFRIGEALTVREGRDVGVVASGYAVWLAVEAAERAAKEGVSVEVLDVHTLKPMDRGAIVKIAKKTGALVTVEEHSLIGGLRSAVAEIVTEDYPIPVKCVGIQDRFGESALEYDELLKAYGITVDNILEKVREALQNKR